MDLNLDTLKREIVEYLGSAGFAVFYSSPGVLEDIPVILWDTARHPDYRMFLDTARAVGSKLICFGVREFESSDLDELLAQVDDCGLSRDDERNYESRLREMRAYEGATCSLELAFDHDSRLYVYEMQPDWYEDFLNIEETVLASFGVEDESDGGETLGGYYSKN